MRRNRSICLIGAMSAIFAFLLISCIRKEPVAEEVQTTLETELLTEEWGQESESGVKSAEAESGEPIIKHMDWSLYFGRLNGAAVLYDDAKKQYSIYNPELANEQRSPCSTFKIISSLIGLESGVIVPGDSTLPWNGEIYWNEAWNKDIDFAEAFRTSCVWYYRKIIDKIGQEAIQNELNRLHYGNCDIADWEGRLNTNNNNRALTGFWIESSLKISALEQVQVMRQIFGEESVYKEDSIAQLKEVMLVTDYETEHPVYGKTGMGKVSGQVVDSWFTGFAEVDGKEIYFCVYLGYTDNADVSSAKAKEIGLRIISEND